MNKERKDLFSKLNLKHLFGNLNLSSIACKLRNMTIHVTNLPASLGATMRKKSSSNRVQDQSTHSQSDRIANAKCVISQNVNQVMDVEMNSHQKLNTKKLTNNNSPSKIHESIQHPLCSTKQKSPVTRGVKRPLSFRELEASNQLAAPKSSNTNELLQQAPCTVTEYSSATKQFLDIIDLASGRGDSRVLSVKDRIDSLIRNVNRRTWASNCAPRFPGIGVPNMVKDVEGRNKKPLQPELIRHTPFVVKKGLIIESNARKNAGKWQKEIAREKFVNVPQPSAVDVFRFHLNSVQSSPYSAKKIPNKMIEEKGRDEHRSGITDMLDESRPAQARLIVTSLCEYVDESGFNFDEMTDLDAMWKYKAAHDYEADFVTTEFADIFKNEKYQKPDDFHEIGNRIEESDNQTIKNEIVSSLTEISKSQYYLELQEKQTKSDPTVVCASSINELITAQIESETVNEAGIQYFLEEECVMLSPYSNEAKLYRLLFPGQRIPVKTETTQFLDFTFDETTTELQPSENLLFETCTESTVDCIATEWAQVADDILVLTSPFSDDMWDTESESEVMPVQVESKREPTPPKLTLTPKEHTPEPEQPPTPPTELLPSPKPEQQPEPKRVRRLPPPKKKKVYDRNFVKAIQMNQLDRIEQLLYDGADPDTSCSIGTVLHQAAQLGFAHAVQMLLWWGANTEIRNELGDTPLHLASIAGYNEIVLMLTVNNCDVDAVNNYDITPLHMALSYGKLQVIQSLVRMNADPDSPDRIGDTPRILCHQLGYPKETLDSVAAEMGPITDVPAPLTLVQGIENNSLRDVQRALTEKASPNTLVPLALHWPGHSTVLHRAAHLGYDSIVEELLRAGSDVRARDIVGNTPLHTAVQDGHNGVVEMLLKFGADANASTQSGVTALHRAAAKGHEGTAILLLKYGANAQCQDHQGKTAQDWARQKGFVKLARYLQDHVA